VTALDDALASGDEAAFVAAILAPHADTLAPLAAVSTFTGNDLSDGAELLVRALSRIAELGAVIEALAVELAAADYAEPEAEPVEIPGFWTAAEEAAVVRDARRLAALRAALLVGFFVSTLLLLAYAIPSP
jgi:hypothetical protein